MSLAKDFRGLPAELRLAALAAAALVVSLILPWYQKSYVPAGTRDFVQANVSALGAFSFVEAAVLLVASAVLFLVWARSQRKAFHLPGGDGFAITIAGGWAVLLLVWRLFDKPDIKGDAVTVGIQWGIFGALLAASALVAAGARVRAAHRPEPPNPAADDVGWVAPDRPARERARDRRPRDAAAVKDVLRERPTWEGGPPDAETRRFRDDDEATRRMADPGEDATRRMRDPGDEATRRTRDAGEDATRRMRDPGDEATRRTRDAGEDATRRMRDPGDEATRRLPRDPSDEATRRFGDDAETRRLPDDAATRRLPRDSADERTRRPWDDDESAS